MKFFLINLGFKYEIMTDKKSDYKGHFSKSKMKVTATETERKVEIEIPENEAENVTAGLIKINHSRGLFNDFFTINQEFLMYVLSIGLSGKDWEVFVFLLARMEYGNKIMLNNQVLANAIGLSKGQVSKAMKKLEKSGVVLKKKIYTARYEISFNYDMINPNLGFKGKVNKKNIENHKELIKKENPYQKHYNIEGNIDLINTDTGVVFHTIHQSVSEKEDNIKIFEKNNTK